MIIDSLFDFILADRCSPPNKGCADNELCLPAGGYNKCHCKRGYLRQNGICVKETHHVTTTVSSVTKTGTSEGRTGGRTLPTTGGQGRGGDGKGVETRFQPTRGPKKKKVRCLHIIRFHALTCVFIQFIKFLCGRLLENQPQG